MRHAFRFPSSHRHRSRADASPPRLPSAEAGAKLASAENALSSALGAQVAEAMTGRGRLDSAQSSLQQLQARLRAIDALCAACRDLVRHDDLIRQLAVVRANFGATLSRATTILDLPEEAARTLAELAQESELVYVFEALVELDAKCVAAQRLFEEGGGGGTARRASGAADAAARRARNAEHRARVEGYFAKVDAARETFEAKLWAQLRKALHLGSTGAPLMVRVLRVVQEQEAMDAALAADSRGGGAGHAAAPRRYRAAALAAVERAVDERCEKLLPDPIMPRPQDEDGQIRVTELLVDVQDCYRGLEEISDYIVPCFPEGYDVLQVVVRRYHVRLVQFYDRLGALAEAPANSEILELVRSHEEYEAMLRDLLVPEEWYDITPVPMPYEAPAPAPAARRGRPMATREAVAAAEADARARAREAAAASGGNWEGGGAVPVDAAARAIFTGIALDTAGLTVSMATGLASGLAHGTLGVVKGVVKGGQAMGNLVTGKGLWGDAGAPGAPGDAEPDDAPAAPPPPPSAALWVPGTGGGLSHLQDVYVRRVRDNTARWMQNMVAADLALPPSQEEGGRLWTPAGVDFFRSLNEQLEAVLAVTRGELLVRVVVAISALMLDFQRLQNAAVERPLAELTLEVLCAYVNNNERCYDMCKEMVDNLQEAAPDEASRLEVLEIADQGFLDTAVAAMKKAVEMMFLDPGFASTFAALFCAPDWWEGVAVGTLCATAVDFLGDFAMWLTPSFFKRIAKAVMERTVAAYCAALFVQCGAIKTGTMARIAADEQELRETFAAYCDAAPLATIFQTLTDLRELACASTEAEIANAFGTMLRNTPGTTVDVVERILALRDDIPKPVKKQIVHACHEQWAERTGAAAGGLAAAAQALGGATAATAAAIQDAIKVALSRNRWFG